MTYTAVVLAGSRPGGDELAQRFGTDLKAVIPILGEPMISLPVRALLASGSVGNVIIASQEPDRLKDRVPPDRRLRFSKAHSTIAQTMLELTDDPATRWPLLITTADSALLDEGMIEEFLRGAQSCDIAIGVVEKANLLARLPDTERTWLKFRGGAYTGANLFALRSANVRPGIELWRSVEQDRKKAWRVMSLLGPGLLLAVMLRLVSIDEVMGQLSGRLGLETKAVPLSNPLAGVDVDKPSDHRLVEAILGGKA